MKNIKYLIGLVALMLSITSCEKDDPVIPHEEELITTLIYTLTPQGGGTPVEFKYQDLDGDGGNAPVVTVGTLLSNTTYTGTIQVLNETESPAEDITEEIEEEGEEHQFFYQETGLNATVAYTDTDESNNPIGITTTFATSNAATGTLTITLRHEPNKSASGVSDGDITNAGGSTDVEAVFNVVVEQQPL